MGWLQALAAELAITLADGSVWLSIGQGLLFGAMCLLLGVGVARFVGLLSADAPAGETLGVGLGSGLLVVAAWWAAVASGGRSSFTPVAVGFVIAIGLAVLRRWRARDDADVETIRRQDSQPGDPPKARRRDLIAVILGGGVFVVAVALLYGSTLTLSPRDGMQPLEFNDTAFYSVLGADLAETGTESFYSPSGFERLDGLPTQTWYHWGELWLGAAVISVFGMAPLDARHFAVLPVLLLAAAALTGTLVRRMTGAASRGAFLFGFLACLFLAPMPLIPGPFFSGFARGLVYGITAYGLAAVGVLLALYSFAVLGPRRASWALCIFVGSATALIVPAHIVVAVLGLVGIGSVWTVRIGQSLVTTRRLPVVTSVWQRTIVATGILVVSSITWGVLTGHGVGNSGSSPSVSTFNSSWRDSVAITTACAGAFLAIAVAWFMVRKISPMEAGLYLGTTVILIFGAFVWGALLGDFTMVHLFLAGIVVFGTPAAAVAVWSIWLRLRADGRYGLAVGLLLLCVAQLEIGIAAGVVRLVNFGPQIYAPVPEEMLAAIKALPVNAKLAYACRPSEEVSFWEPRLIGIDAHASRRFVPMCFQAEVTGAVTGAVMSADIENPLFDLAPQRALYPTSDATPSDASVAAFLKANGITYIYADAMHPNTLVPDAVPVVTSGPAQVLQLR